MGPKKGKKSGNKKGKEKAQTSGSAHASSSTPARPSSIAAPPQPAHSTVVATEPSLQDPLIGQAAEALRRSSVSSDATTTVLSVEDQSMDQAATGSASVTGSKGKERAIDPQASKLLVMLTDPNLTVETLATQFRALGIGASVIKPDVVSYSGAALGLEASTASDGLKNRGQRMASFQRRTHKEHAHGAFVAAESADSFVVRLLAAQQATAAARQYRDRIYANRAAFLTKYMWGHEPVWSATDDHFTMNFEPDFDDHEANWKALTAALRQYSKENTQNAKIMEIVHQDFDRIGRMLDNKVVKSTVDRIFKHPEFTSFCRENAGGLVIHAYDADYRQKADNLSRGLQRLWKGRLPTSAVSAFAYRFMMDFKGPGHVMMHIAGLCNTGGRRAIHNLGGWRGLFRSLCNQLIAQKPFQKGLELTRLTQKCLDELESERPRKHIFLKLFRDLILDVAEYIVRENCPTNQIIVIIDGLDWFEDRDIVSTSPIFNTPALVQIYKEVMREHGPYSPVFTNHQDNMPLRELSAVQAWLRAEARGEDPTTSMPLLEGVDQPPMDSDKSLEMIVEFFRDLAAECNYSDLGTKVHFKYILLHPLSSKIGMYPSVLERYITLDKDL